jgi:hypothetical protein
LFLTAEVDVMDRRTHLRVWLAAFGLVSGLPAAAEPVADARASAMAWLARIDAADYDASWNSAAQVFQRALSSAAWRQAADAARAPLGKLRQRREQSATFTRTLPGAPDGEYVVLKFDSTFESKAQAVETAVAVRESGGAWKVAGYFIQ